MDNSKVKNNINNNIDNNNKKHPGGRPPTFANPEDMQKLIDQYFKDCEGEMWLDDNGEPIVTKYGPLYKKQPKPPTVTGLALALGFTSRQALLNYQAKPAFVDTVTRAKARIEEYVETRLFDKDGVNGAKFSLINNFKGWRDKQEVDLANTGDKPFDITIRVVE